MVEIRLNSIGTGILEVFGRSDRVTDRCFGLLWIGEGTRWQKHGLTRLAPVS